MGQLDGRFALITGGAAGMGLATVKEFLAEGARVFAVDIRPDRLEALEHSQSDAMSGGKLVTFAGDLGNADDLACLVSTAKTHGTVDIIVNNAGIFDFHESTLTMTRETWERVLNINTTVHFVLAQAFIPGMLEMGKGAIIGIASAAGLVGGGGGIAYTASKHAVVGLGRQLAVEFGPRGIRANTICPGVVQTPLLETVGSDIKSGLDAFVSSIPARRIADPREIARAAVFLASDDASFIHGAALPVDGGYTAI